MTENKTIIAEIMERMNNPGNAFRIGVVGGIKCMLIDKKCQTEKGGWGGFIPGDCRYCVFANHFLEHLGDSWFFDENKTRTLLRESDILIKRAEENRKIQEQVRKERLENKNVRRRGL